ncbi:hypothetical protein HG717_16000 [Rhodococcus erythropolis]|uniref:hypothetical protein n=1 Tax=Rhodococcus erythropolis TaxID=1833 RepID=UPI001C9AF5B4|nr:hypothetical protein [Rhodococcus erythropolis]MBY6385403.1 hypothetical protein [Rhodococcus erythropolis]
MRISRYGAGPRSPGWLAVSLVLSTIVLMFGITAVLAAPAGAAPVVPPREAFTASECENSNGSGVGDLVIDRARLADYNDGQIVPMYYNRHPDGMEAIAPGTVCGVFELPGTGPTSEWMYCTDKALKICGQTTPEGESGYWTGTEWVVTGSAKQLAGNPRLNEDQQLIISYLLQNPHPYVDKNGVTGIADNGNSWNRSNRQELVWCISDGSSVADCEASLGQAERERILAIMKSTPALTISGPANWEVGAGETATFTVSTNLYGIPLAIGAPAGTTVSLCDPAATATLTGNTLTVTGTDTAGTEVLLCVTAEDPGDVTISVGGQPNSHEKIRWNQSDPVCQVFATFETKLPARISDSASVTFLDTPVTTTPVTTTPVTTTPVTTTPVTTTKTNTAIIPIPIPIPIPGGTGSSGGPTQGGAPTSYVNPAPNNAGGQSNNGGHPGGDSTPTGTIGGRPTAIDGGTADQSSGPHIGIAVVGLSVIALAACGVIVIKRNRT